MQEFFFIKLIEDKRQYWLLINSHFQKTILTPSARDKRGFHAPMREKLFKKPHPLR
jgi:hypothetical protein